MQEAAGPMQVCSGLTGGAKVAIYSIKELFGMEENNAVILVDASNAFNCLDQKVARHDGGKVSMETRYTCAPKPPPPSSSSR